MGVGCCGPTEPGASPGRPGSTRGSSAGSASALSAWFGLVLVSIGGSGGGAGSVLLVGSEAAVPSSV